jgi:DNA-binding protein H-NS
MLRRPKERQNQREARQKELQQEIARVGAYGERKLFITPRKGNNTWSGRGTQPGCVKDHIAAGGTLDDLKA